MKNNMIYKLAANANMPEDKAKNIEKIIQDHSLAAAATAATACFLPAVGVTIAGIIAKGFTWTMLFRICLELGIDVSKESLKSFASAITAKVAAYLAAVAAGGVILSLVPVGNMGASALGVLLGYSMVYASGLLFMGMMGRVAEYGEVNEMTAEEILDKLEHEQVTREEIAKAAEAAMKTYAEEKKAPVDGAAVPV